MVDYQLSEQEKLQDTISFKVEIPSHKEVLEFEIDCSGIDWTKERNDYNCPQITIQKRDNCRVFQR